MTIQQTLEGLYNLREDFEDDLLDFVFSEPDYEEGKQEYIDNLTSAIELLEAQFKKELSI